MFASAARSQTAQEYLLSTHYQSTAAATLQPSPNTTCVAGLMAPRTPAGSTHYHTMVRHSFPRLTPYRQRSDTLSRLQLPRRQSRASPSTPKAVPTGAVSAPRFAVTTTQYTRPQAEKRRRRQQAENKKKQCRPSPYTAADNLRGRGGSEAAPRDGVLYILDLRHRIKVDSVVAGNANQFDRIFFTIAAGPLTATAMSCSCSSACFFIFVRLCCALWHSGAVLPIATGCLVYLSVTALFVVGLVATSSIPSALPPPDARSGRGFFCFRNSWRVALRVGQLGGSTGSRARTAAPADRLQRRDDGGAVLLLQPRHGDARAWRLVSRRLRLPPWPPHCVCGRARWIARGKSPDFPVERRHLRQRPFPPYRTVYSLNS
jgi:hypothetical protein